MKFLALIGTHCWKKKSIETNTMTPNHLENHDRHRRLVISLKWIYFIFLLKFWFCQQVLKQLAEVVVEARHFWEDWILENKKDLLQFGQSVRTKSLEWLTTYFSSENYLSLRLWDENRSLINVRFFQRFQ